MIETAKEVAISRALLEVVERWSVWVCVCVCARSMRERIRMRERAYSRACEWANEWRVQRQWVAGWHRRRPVGFETNRSRRISSKSSEKSHSRLLSLFLHYFFFIFLFFFLVFFCHAFMHSRTMHFFLSGDSHRLHFAQKFTRIQSNWSRWTIRRLRCICRFVKNSANDVSVSLKITQPVVVGR